MPDPAAAILETHLARLDPDLASVFRLLFGELRDLHQSVHTQTQGIVMANLNLDRTIQAARRLENAAEAVVKVLNDTVSNQREISAKFGEAQTKLQETQAQLSEALGKLNTGSTQGAGETSAVVADLETKLREANAQIEAMGTAQTSLDALSNEMEAKADAIGQAVVANTPAATDGSAPKGTGAVGDANVGAGGATRAAAPGERIPGAGQSNLPPNTASNKDVQENLGNPDGNPGGAPGGQTGTGPMTGVPTSRTDASSQVQPESAPPVPPANI